MRYFLGCMSAIVAGLVFVAASVAQKRAINGLGDKAPLFRNVVKSPLWLAGFISSFVVGAPLNMASYAAIGPTLPPALVSIGLAATPIMARLFLGERPAGRAFAGAAAIATGIALLGLSGAAIAPENLDWGDPGLLLRGSATALVAVGAAGACMIAGIRGKGSGALPLSLAAGTIQALSNALMGPLAGQIFPLLSGDLRSSRLIVAGAASLVLIAVNLTAIAVSQLALRKGKATSVIPLQHVPVQALPLAAHFIVYRSGFGGTMHALMAAVGAAILIAGAFVIGPTEKPGQKPTAEVSG